MDDRNDAAIPSETRNQLRDCAKDEVNLSAKDQVNLDCVKAHVDLETKYVAPDGGWGWVVCFACLMTHVLIDGVTYSFGIIFVEFLDYYEGTKAETAWIISLSTSVCYLCGPFVAALTSQFGCRNVAAAGTIITSASLILSIYTPSLHFLYFSFGILYGIGYGMTYLPTIVCVSEYFDKRRAFATGLGVCGGGIGTFIFSPLTAVLVEAYGWRGAILIQAGLILNCLACSLVYRPLELVKHNAALLIPEAGDDSYSAEIILELNNPDSTKAINGHAIGKHKDCDIPENMYMLQDAEKDTLTNVKKRPDEKCTKYVVDDVKTDDKTHSKLYDRFRPLIRATAASFKESFSIELLKNKALLLFVISYFFYSLGYFTPYVYLPVKSRDVGVDELGAAWILATIGIANTVGRVLFGFLSDKAWMNRLYLYSTSLVICGVGTSLGPLLNSFESLLMYAAVFGMFSGVTISLTSVLIADIVGIRNLSSAFGIANFAGGVAILVGPPFGGWLSDISGSYNGAFLAAGITIVISGAILFAIPCVDKQWKKQ